MILDKETEEKFGYLPSDLTGFSTFKILVKCDYCGEIVEREKKNVTLRRIYTQRDTCSNHTCMAKKAYETLRSKKMEKYLYEDKNWLHNEYIEKKTSIREMAKIANCNYKTIAIHLNKFKIKRGNEPIHKRKGTLLDNKEWLHQKYIIEKLSCPEIANILNVKHWNVLSALKYFGFEIRSSHESQSIVLTKRKLENEKKI